MHASMSVPGAAQGYLSLGCSCAPSKALSNSTVYSGLLSWLHICVRYLAFSTCALERLLSANYDKAVVLASFVPLTRVLSIS